MNAENVISVPQENLDEMFELDIRTSSTYEEKENGFWPQFPTIGVVNDGAQAVPYC